MNRWHFRIGLALLACLHIALAMSLPYADDELYYWCWAEQLQPSYFDHPPMTALLIRASQTLFGDNALGLRFPAILSTWIVLIVLARLTRTSILLLGIVLTPVYTFGAAVVTPDTPLLMFWALYLAWLIKMQRQPKPPRWGWLVGGLILGCGMLGKYTSALLVPAGAMSFCFSGIDDFKVAGTLRVPSASLTSNTKKQSARRACLLLLRAVATRRTRSGRHAERACYFGIDVRRWLPGYILHGIVATMLFMPVVWFNFEHDFAPIRFQWNHAMADGSNPLETFSSFVGTQLLLVGFMPIAILPWAILNVKTLQREPRSRVCFWLFVLPMVLFLYKSLKGPLEANWALAAYIGGWPLLVIWYESRTQTGWKRVAWLGFIIPIATTMLLAWHLVEPIALLSPRQDRIGKEIAKQTLTDELHHDFAELEPLPIMTITYQWTARLRHAGLPAVQLAGATRDSNFTLRPQTMADFDRLYVFAEGPLLKEYVPGFGPPTILQRYTVRVRGVGVHELALMYYQRSTP